MAETFEVLEKAFYIFSEPSTRPQRDHELISMLPFQGASDGEIRLLLGRGLAESMTENMLAIERRSVTDALVADCVRECAKMIGFNFLSKIDPGGTYRPGVPSFETIANRSCRSADPPSVDAAVELSAKEGELRVILTGRAWR